MKTAIAGYPRIGARRELKFRTEEYFRGEIDETALSNAARAIRLGNWMTLKGRGIDSIPSNDFSLYDGMLGDDTAFTLEGDKPFEEYGEALAAGITTRPFIIGPFTFLTLASYTITPGTDRAITAKL